MEPKTSFSNSSTTIPRAVVVLSGGLDSSTCLYIAKSQGYEVFPVTFRYGQVHQKEIQSAFDVASYAEVAQPTLVDLPIPNSALTGKGSIPENRNIEQISKEIPVTEVPFRNSIFILLACQYAHNIGAKKVFVGITAIDYSGYPDCRPEFLAEMNQLIIIQEKDIEVVAPLLHLYKAEIIQWGTELCVPYQLTWSCYKGSTKACGKCDSCVLRLKGFREAGLTDPQQYDTN